MNKKGPFIQRCKVGMCQAEAPGSRIALRSLGCKAGNPQDLKQFYPTLKGVVSFLFPPLLHVLARWFPRYDLCTPEFPATLSGGPQGRNTSHTNAESLFFPFHTNPFTSIRCFPKVAGFAICQQVGSRADMSVQLSSTEPDVRDFKKWKECHFYHYVIFVL